MSQDQPDRHATSREERRRKRGQHPKHGKSVFVIQELLARKAERGRKAEAKGVPMCDHGRYPPLEYCARCAL